MTTDGAQVCFVHDLNGASWSPGKELPMMRIRRRART
jgi:hypothetical protein